MAPSFVSTMTVVSQPPKSTEAIKRAIGVKTFRFFRMFVVSLAIHVARYRVSEFCVRVQPPVMGQSGSL